ncbi:MAG: glycosyltransferase family 39 protein [Patescibacteria group bacterium]|nr:glycosyltransferase family 39 protein [Patescibacteria group bacterium]
MKYFSPKWILIIIIALGLFLRTWQLNVSPPGFNADEAALGYNAYSLLHTGKDEWGVSFPLVFKSFSDYKPGVYVYLAMPFVAILGLSEFAVRLPSILFGTLSIFLIYLLAKKFFKDEIVSLSTAFLLAISPWAIHFSRGAWETNVATTFLLIGILAFVKGLENMKWFYLSVAAFIISMYTYQSTRLIAPLLVFFLVVFYYKQILKTEFSFKKAIIGPVALGGLLIIPLMFSTLTDHGLARFQGVSIFTDVGIINRTNEERGEHQNPHDLVALTFHNKFIGYGLNFLNHYFDHFSPAFLFTQGDPLGRDKTPEMGQLYLFEIFTLLAGLYFLTTVYKNTKIILIWLFIAPLAASLTYQTPHALRAENMVIPLELISGLGLGILIRKLWRHRNAIKIPVTILAISVMSFFILKFLHEYFVHLPKEYALEWEYGFSQVVPYVIKNENKYQKIVVTNRYDQPYILFLFYSRYDPLRYQQIAQPTIVDNFGFSTIASFDKFEFRKISPEEVLSSKDTLFVGTADEIPNNAKIVDKVDFPNGKPAFIFAE